MQVITEQMLADLMIASRGSFCFIGYGFDGLPVRKFFAFDAENPEVIS